jgi:uncharacterized membrane protein (Fun14 family)
MRAIVLLLHDIHILHTILLRRKGVTTIESSALGWLNPIYFKALQHLETLKHSSNHISNVDVGSHNIDPPTRFTHVAIMMYDKYSL